MSLILQAEGAALHNRCPGYFATPLCQTIYSNKLNLIVIKRVFQCPESFPTD